MPNKTITLDQLMELEPCYDRDRILEISGGKEEMSAVEILKLNIPAKDRLWLLLHTHFFSESDLRMMAAAFAEQSLKYFEREYPNDDRPRKAIRASRLFAMGEIDDAARSAAVDAAWSAAEDASWSEAWSEARSAAVDAAVDAARSATVFAARSAARSAAVDAAWSEARSAAVDAAWSAAEDASVDASVDAARSTQIEIVRFYIAG